MTQPRVFTVVLNYKHPEDTLKCIASLRLSRARTHLLVVDNGSGDEVVAELARAVPPASLITSDENLGYAGGNNLGIRYALDHGADFVWVLNPDTTVDPGTLGRLVETMHRMPNAGIAGCKILNGNAGGEVIWFNGATIDWSRGGAASHVDNGKRDADVRDRRIRPTDYVTGASMLVRRQVFEDVGLLPERYFLYFEEADFNTRARRRGWQLIVDPNARVQHFQRSWEVVPTVHYVYYYTRNRILFARAFGDYDVDELIADFSPNIDDWWRRRFRKSRPEWLPGFERVVAWALEDARAERDGRRDDITGLTWEALASA